MRSSPKHFDESPAFHLIGRCCRNCGHTSFPGADVCPACQHEGLDALPLPVAGTLYSWTVLHVVPKPWRAPLTVGYVDLPLAGERVVRVFAHLGGDPQTFVVDMPVSVVAAVVGASDDGTPRPFFKFEAGPRQRGDHA